MSPDIFVPYLNHRQSQFFRLEIQNDVELLTSTRDCADLFRSRKKTSMFQMFHYLKSSSCYMVALQIRLRINDSSVCGHRKATPIIFEKQIAQQFVSRTAIQHFQLGLGANNLVPTESWGLITDCIFTFTFASSNDHFTFLLTYYRFHIEGSR